MRSAQERELKLNQPIKMVEADLMRSAQERELKRLNELVKTPHLGMRFAQERELKRVAARDAGYGVGDALRAGA